jgi:hypothetical protein
MSKFEPGIQALVEKVGRMLPVLSGCSQRSSIFEIRVTCDESFFCIVQSHAMKVRQANAAADQARVFRELPLESLRDTHIALQKSTEAGVVEWSRNQAVRHAQARSCHLFNAHAPPPPPSQS